MKIESLFTQKIQFIVHQPSGNRDKPFLKLKVVPLLISKFTRRMRPRDFRCACFYAPATLLHHTPVILLHPSIPRPTRTSPSSALFNLFKEDLDFPETKNYVFSFLELHINLLNEYFIFASARFFLLKKKKPPVACFPNAHVISAKQGNLARGKFMQKI
jgi:hypothetical protein